MTNVSNLSCWLANIKADDIDGGLAADFDGSLSGLGVELGSSTYNMSEALLALPVFKQELNFDSGFQYVLGAPTSPATKMYEDTLTYLNQGQSYELKVKKLGELGNLRGKYLRSVIRVMFHERRLQYNEKEQLDFWKMMRPGERIVDVDVPLSYGVVEIKINKKKLNCVEFVWDPHHTTGLYIKIHAISTEFTPKKHGGEKGVPFRLQVETYLNDEYDPRLLYAGSCQVKVFKPKGADRKHKTDLMKLEKRSDSEKDKYQPSYECTVLTEIPSEQIKNYLEQVEKEDRNVSFEDNDNTAAATTSADTTSKISKSVKTPCLDMAELTLGSTGTAVSAPSALSTVGDLAALLEHASSEDSGHSGKAASSCTSYQEATDSVQIEPLSPKATAQNVTEWLHSHRFSGFVKVFQSFSGADLLRLSREDLIQICGLANGIRLNNALQSRTVRPKLTIYIYQPRGTGIHCVEKHTQISQSSTKSTSSTSSKGPRQTKSTSSQEHVSPLTHEAMSAPQYTSQVTTSPEPTNKMTPQVSPTNSTATGKYSHRVPECVTVQATGSQAAGDPFPMPDLDLEQSSSQKQTLLDNPQTVHKKDSKSKSRIKSDYGTQVPPEGSTQDDGGGADAELGQGSGVNKRSSVSSVGGQGWKRQYREAEESDTECEVNYTKKQRTRTLGLSRKEVYHAVYLEFLTVHHLKEKLAASFSIGPHQIQEIHVQASSGIHILVTDNVIQNFPDESRYNIEAREDDVMLGYYNILLQTTTS